MTMPDQLARIGIAAVAGLLFLTQAVGHAEESPKLAKYRPEVDRSVDRALEFLAGSQVQSGAADGLFRGQYGKTNAVASLVGMAFMAKGYTPRTGRYSHTIRSCIDYVLSTPTKNGYLGVRGGNMYSHGIATLFLSEVSGMVGPERQKQIDALLPKALKVIIDAQKAPKKRGEELGGWRYQPNSRDSDLSLTGWQIMALRSARINGAPVPAQTIKNATDFVLRNYRDRGWRKILPADIGGFVYTNSHHVPGRRGRWVEVVNPKPQVGMTGVGLLCLELMGRHNSERCRRSGNFILSMTKGKDLIDDGRHRTYAIYYCAQAMHQLGGKHWEVFGERLYKYLLRTQGKNGAWAVKGEGDIYPTAMYVLALSVSYCQLPIYQR